MTKPLVPSGTSNKTGWQTINVFLFF